jgi:HK97 family phage prohead protease
MTDSEMRYKDNSLPLEVPDEKGFVEGYASVYGVVDSQKEVVDRGAFVKALADPKKLKFLWQHDYKRPIGRIVKLWEDDYGLKYQARYNLKTSWGKDAYEAAVNGDIDGNSIGYTMHNGKAFKDDEGVNHLQDVGLMEISNVTFPSNTEAVNTDVKDVMRTKTITAQDKTDLLAGINKENLQDLTSYHRRLHQWAAQGNLLTGFSQSDMNWLHSAVEAAMCKINKANGNDCADKSPLEWKADSMQFEFKCAHISAVTDRIKEREDAKAGGGKADGNTMETKAGRVLSTKNEADLTKANDLLDQAGDLIEGVLTQVTGTDYNEPGEKPTTGAAAAPAAAPGKSDNDEQIRLKLTELNKLLRI